MADGVRWAGAVRETPPVHGVLPAGAPASGWPPEVASTVYRIAQEALTNIACHAPGARSVVVTVTHDLRQLIVEVTDDAPASRHHRSALTTTAPRNISPRHLVVRQRCWPSCVAWLHVVSARR